MIKNKLDKKKAGNILISISVEHNFLLFKRHLNTFLLRTMSLLHDLWRDSNSKSVAGGSNGGELQQATRVTASITEPNSKAPKKTFS